MTTAFRGESRSGQEALLARLAQVDFPTLGHFLEQGFVAPAVRRLGLPQRMIGIAATLALDAPDAAAVNRAILELGPGDVLVVDTRGNQTHAVIGAVTAAALRSRGASGVLVDGVVTDIEALTDPGTGICVHARGTSCLTTKKLGGESGRRQVAVEVGGVRINPGDVVLGDANGVIALRPGVLASVLDEAEQSDAQEPALLRALARGEDLRSLLHLG
ncbi:RraA family protein [Streptomyces sp. NPDC055105]|uniref:RraA family protein n=1 Tax=Streptomyces sp. NPDC055105 TaxID=3365719 RepID=UPI0037D078E9